MFIYYFLFRTCVVCEFADGFSLHVVDCKNVTARSFKYSRCESNVSIYRYDFEFNR